MGSAPIPGRHSPLLLQTLGMLMLPAWLSLSETTGVVKATFSDHSAIGLEISTETATRKPIGLEMKKHNSKQRIGRGRYKVNQKILRSEWCWKATS